MRQGHCAKMRFAVSGSKLAIGAEMRPPVLDGVTRFIQSLNAVVERHDPGNLISNRLAGLAAKQFRAVGINCGGEFEKDFPFSSGFADLARNFRAEDDAALGD